MVKLLGSPGPILILYILTYMNYMVVTSWALFGSWKEDDWKGNWFPHSPNQATDNNPTVQYNYKKSDIHDNHHGIMMGIPTEDCDNGKNNLDLDWNRSPVNYTCYEDKKLYLPKRNVYPLFSSDHIPVKYSAIHKCMDTPIFYDNEIPTFGAHRPLWPKYGEYKFVPIQRWLHNLEHGALVMLYHPCASRTEVNLLRHLVTNCLYRHIITPYSFLTPERPLALVTWGRRLVMSKVDPKLVIDFIKTYAKHGPEHTARDGQYDLELIHHSDVVTDNNDTVLCPLSNVVQTMK